VKLTLEEAFVDIDYCMSYNSLTESSCIPLLEYYLEARPNSEAI